MSVWYLELDDEITDAVARLRAAKDDRVVLVVPPGSRIGTGRINFRLLAREAESRGLALALVSGDAQVRALAASAGLDVYATVSASEAIEAAGGGAANGVSPTSSDGGAAVATTSGAAAAAATRSTAPGPTALASPDARPRTDAETARATAARRQRRRRMAILGAGTAAVLLAASGGLYGLYVSIPTASIVLLQQDHVVPPVELALTVREDQPSDALTGTVAGRRLPISVTVSGTVVPTGPAEPLTERAHGTVTFFNHGPNPITVADQTIVSTTTGVRFETQGGNVVQPASSGDVQIFAVEQGEFGNVEAGTITEMDAELRNRLGNGTVTNKEPTEGGKSEPQSAVTQADYDSAVAQLTAQLRADLGLAAETPAGLPIDGVVYPATVATGGVVTVPPAGSVVNQLAPTAIEATMTGSVLTASLGDIERIAAEKLQAQAPPGTEFVDGSISVEAGAPTMSDEGLPTYVATATGRAWDRALDPTALKEQLRGKTKSAAQAILDLLGEATITLSPDFMWSLPDDPNRIVLTITPLGSPAP